MTAKIVAVAAAQPERGERECARVTSRPARGERPGARRREGEGRPRLRSACGLVALLLLAGCNVIDWPKPPPTAAASAGAWVRPGTDAAAVQASYDDCLSLANAATDTDFAIDQDIAASRGSDMQHSNFAGASLRGARQTSRDRAQTALSSCMNQKGYTLAK